MSGPVKVGVSGGIGSGKTFICKLLEERGYPVYYSDPAAKALMNENPIIKENLIKLFGPEVYIDNLLNRPFLASIIFHNDEKRELVNKIVHPVVRQDFLNWSSKQSAHIIFQESALLFDAKAYQLFDSTILVIADPEVRVQRIISRDGISREEAVARIESQGDQKEFKKLAKYCIENNINSNPDLQLEAILKEIYSTSS